MVEAKLSTDFPEAAVREAAELTLPRGEEGSRRIFISTTTLTVDGTAVGGSGLARRLRGTLQGHRRRGVGERLCYGYLEMHWAVNFRKPGDKHKAKVLWLRDAKANGEACRDRSG